MAGDGDGNLILSGNSPYGIPASMRVWKWKGPIVPTKWVQGRGPGTFAIRPGPAVDSVVHSRFYTTKDNRFALEGWFRFHQDSGPLLRAGDAHKSGFCLSVRAQGKDDCVFFWRIGTKEGGQEIQSPPVAARVWHQVVAVLDTASMTLFVDGKSVSHAKIPKGSYVPPAVGPDIKTRPENDIEGMRIGGIRSSQIGAATFDLDELIVFSRVPTETEIEKRYEKGRPTGPLGEQRARYVEEMTQEVRRDQIVLSIPLKTYGYFPVKVPIPARIEIPESLSGRFEAEWIVRDLKGDVVFHKKKTLDAREGNGASAAVSPALDDCGLYFLEMNVRSKNGEILKQQEFSLGSIVPLPPVSEIPATSPVASHGIISRHPEMMALGAKTDRIIRGWRGIERTPGVYSWEYEDEQVAEARKNGLEIMWCLHGIPDWEQKAGNSGMPKNLDHYKKWLTEMVRRYKGDVRYWEVMNEPNSGSTSAMHGPDRVTDYVALLKASHEVIKKEDPTALVVGLSGCPGFIPWSEQVLAAGGAPYFDVLTLHNYRAAPLIDSARERPIQRMREILTRYGSTALIWEGEFGFRQPARTGDRPLTAKEFWEQYDSRIQLHFGQRYVSVDMPMVPEPQAACWTIQAILVDLADGASRYFLLGGPGEFHPGLTEYEGSPTLMGVALAAVNSRLTDSVKVERLAMPSPLDAGVLILQKDGKRDLAVFSESNPVATFRTDPDTKIRGMDWLGTPQSWQADHHGILHLPVDPHPTYLFDIPKSFVCAPELSVTGEQELQNGQIAGELEVTNFSADPAEFRLTADTPDGSSVTMRRKINVDSGETKTIPFTLTATDLRQGNHHIEFHLNDKDGTLQSTAEHAFAAHGTVLGIPFVPIPIPMRADPADWAAVPANELADETHVISGKPVPGVPWAPQWKGENDLSVRYRLAWNPEQGILLLIEVKDDQFRPAPDEDLARMFQFDCLELFVDARPQNLRIDGYTPGAEQITVRPQGTEKASPCAVRSASADGTQIDVQFVGRRTVDGYIVQGTLKPKDGAPWKLKENLNLALDFLVDDADADLRKTVMSLFGSLDNSRSTRQWGRYRLHPAKAGP